MIQEILDKIKELHDTIIVSSVDVKPKESLNGMRQLNLITELRSLVEDLNIPDVVGSDEWKADLHAKTQEIKKPKNTKKVRL